MTLVELLVVTGLIAGLLGLVVNGLRTGRQSTCRQGAETLASSLAAAQSRALGVPEGAAMILTPAASGAAAGTALFDAVTLPLIEADVTGVPPSNPSQLSVTGTMTRTNDDVLRAYKILFGGQDNPTIVPRTSWMNFAPTSGTTGTIQFRTDLGQTQSNTTWPKPLASGTLNAVLAQYPAKSSTALQLDPSIAVDLRFSGIGDDRSTTYGRLDNKGAIAVVFDRTGAVAEVIQQVPEPGSTATPGAARPSQAVGPMYFLVVSRDTITADGNTLASADAVWVALSPQTGRTFVAANIAQSGTDNMALQAARANARRGLSK